ncbi:hypothetical protein BH11MYX1_BH11MYX1_22180 [soil metagenome]
MATAADIDRLIEDGLNRYGSGDLDDALAIWEEVLAIDPENAQANSYVDYVRMNYEVLRTDSGMGVADDAVPFGIEDEPEYIIEITQGDEILAAPAPMYMDPLDEGWFIEEETHQVISTRTRSKQLAPRTRSAERAPVIESEPPVEVLELEADEPPELAHGPSPSPEISFDSATREYGDEHRRAATNEFQEEPSSFKAEATPLGFGNIETEVKKRDLGFVQPAQGPARLEVRLRTPSPPPRTVTVPPAAKAPAVELAVPAAPAAAPNEQGGALGNFPNTDLVSTSRGIPVMKRMPGTTNPVISESELLSSLPSPRRITPVRGSTPAGPVGESRLPTRELPDKKRAPAVHDRAETTRGDQLEDLEDISLPSAPTRELAGGLGRALVPPSPAMDDFSISAPTRDIGLRPGGRPASVFPDEDAPTRQNDARQIRQQNATQKLPSLKQPSTTVGDSTRTDVVLPFDPIDARSASILDEIDIDEPPNEAREDRTRRRISALIKRASAWSSQMELDKAAAAVDLALSEDPNSALAQKLIHRNRDAIMAIFQSFLGNLDRQPQLSRPLHELASAPISPRAAFLLSRIDGMLTIDEILDVSGMPRLEAYRHLTQLFLRGILR